jgi:hypothetical protein
MPTPTANATVRPSGLRPDLDVAESAPIAGALACVLAFDGVSRIEPAPKPFIGSGSELLASEEEASRTDRDRLSGRRSLE